MVDLRGIFRHYRWHDGALPRNLGDVSCLGSVLIFIGTPIVRSAHADSK